MSSASYKKISNLKKKKKKKNYKKKKKKKKTKKKTERKNATKSASKLKAEKLNPVDDRNQDMEKKPYGEVKS